MQARLPCEEGVIRAAPPVAESASGARGTWVLLATVLGSSLAFVDGTVVNVALPALQQSLGATVRGAQWVIEAYALFFSALLLVGGALGDRYGRKRVYASGIALFAAASVACAFAPDVATLVAARAVQGVGAALLVPGSLALIAASFPERERGAAIGAWSGWSAITTAAGPIVGGWLVDHASWRWAFAVNVPIALAALAILAVHVPESRDEHAPRRLDVAGAALATVGLAGIVFALIESSQRGWQDSGILAALGAGVLAFAGFLVVEARVAHPMLPLSLFASRTFSGVNLLTFALYGGLSLVFFLVPLVLIQVHGYTAAAAGATMLPFIVILFLLSRWSGRLVDRVGARLPLVVGPAIAAAGFALYALPGTGGGYWTTFFPASVVLGLGMAVTIAPLTTTVMNSVPMAQAGVASGINNAVSRTAGLLAIAVIMLPLLVIFRGELARGLPALDLSVTSRQAILDSADRLLAAPVPQDVGPGRTEALLELRRRAFVRGFRFAVLVAAGLAIAGSAIAAVLVPSARTAKGSSG